MVSLGSVVSMTRLSRISTQRFFKGSRFSSSRLRANDRSAAPRTLRLSIAAAAPSSPITRSQKASASRNLAALVAGALASSRWTV
eukprot:13902415-Heterocapsa_arctica.AAC.1